MHTSTNCGQTEKPARRWQRPVIHIFGHHKSMSMYCTKFGSRTTLTHKFTATSPLLFSKSEIWKMFSCEILNLNNSTAPLFLAKFGRKCVTSCDNLCQSKHVCLKEILVFLFDFSNSLNWGFYDISTTKSSFCLYYICGLLGFWKKNNSFKIFLLNLFKVYELVSC